MHTKGKIGCAKPLSLPVTGLSGAVAAITRNQQADLGFDPQTAPFFSQTFFALLPCLLSLGYAFVVFDFE